MGILLRTTWGRAALARGLIAELETGIASGLLAVSAPLPRNVPL